MRRRCVAAPCRAFVAVVSVTHRIDTMADFLPRRDLAVLSWSGTFAAQLSGSPGSFGISPADVAQYLAKHDALAAAMRLVDKPETRTSPAVALKNQARAELIAEARAL